MNTGQKSLIRMLLAGVTLALASTVAMGDSAPQHGDKPVFKHKKASTMKTIPFKRMDSQSMSNTAIKDGLVGPPGNQPSLPGKQYVTSDNPHNEGLTLEQMKNSLLPAQESNRTIDFQFRPNQQFGDVRRVHQYQLQLPSNRTYNQANYNTTQH